jgi:serine/threonine protein kinase
VSETNPAARPDPTEIDGRYVVEKKLGAGAMGTVYKARDKELGRLVAIKTIRFEGIAASSASLEDLLKRFKQEAKVAANLKHPNIVMLYDWRSTEGLTYLSMEFVDGVGLDRLIASSGKLPLERTAAIGAQVADALAYAHKHGVVHRDIKPANIMIEAGDRVKVTDFGIAKMTDAGAEHLTVTGSLLGTPSYMSPEQARGGALDGRSDLFAVGCILYEMVARQKAFRGESITALIFKIITEEPRPLRELDPNVPDEMLRIISKALAKAPESRYQTGRELADDLLALTRPGFVPTLRAIDSPTLPTDAAAPGVPTIVSPGTARVEPTISSGETAARPAGASSAPPAPGGPPPLPPTVLSPATLRSPAPAPPRRPASARPAPPAVAPGAGARKGGGTGLLVGLGVMGLLVVVAVALGGFYLLSRRTRAPIATPVVEGPSDTTPPAPPVESSAALGSTAEATPPPTSPAESSATAPRQQASAPRPAVPVTTARATQAPAGAAATGPSGGGSSPGAAAAPAPAAAGDYAYLDEVPQEGPDGREVGEALAGKYRSGGSTGYTTGRFKRRERFPHDLVPAERPAAATLGYILVAEEKFHTRQGRYGTLAELAAAQHLFLDVPMGKDGFQRARYRFILNVTGDGFRAEATPIGPVGRPFVVDDSGFVRVDRD